jgi:hypothetical protein
MELTSRSTKEEDVDDKFWLYRDVLKVSECFLFDPHQEYLDPPLQGYRLSKGKFVRIRPVNGRLPSKVLGLHIEQCGSKIRLYDPKTGQYVPTPREVIQQAKAENEKLRREIQALRRLKERRGPSPE